MENNVQSGWKDIIINYDADGKPRWDVSLPYTCLCCTSANLDFIQNMKCLNNSINRTNKICSIPTDYEHMGMYQCTETITYKFAWVYTRWVCRVSLLVIFLCNQHIQENHAVKQDKKPSTDQIHDTDSPLWVLIASITLNFYILGTKIRASYFS